MFASAVGLLALAAGVAAEEGPYGIPSAFTDWDNENWTLKSREYIPGEYQTQLNMANGYFGCAFASGGPFFETVKNKTDPDGLPVINGWPLDNERKTFCTIAFFWDAQPNTTRTNFGWLLQNGYESVISGVPHWGGIIFELDGARLDGEVANTSVSDFQSTLSARHGLATWSYKWSPETADDVTVDVAYSAFVHRSRPNVAAVRAVVTADRDVRVAVTDLIDGRSADRTTFDSKGLEDDGQTMYTAVNPLGIADVTGAVASTFAFDDDVDIDVASRREASGDWVPSDSESTIGQTWDLNLKAGQPATLYKYVGVVSSDAFDDPKALALEASRDALGSGWDELLDEHKAAWGKLLPADSVDDYADADGQLIDDPNVIDLHISSVMSPYYLLQQTLSSPRSERLADHSITVGGLTSESYAGMVFWDADLFMAPGLTLSHPQYARQVANYRILLADQARENARENGYSDGAILYPWTSARYGNCTATGPCVNYQYHLNSDVALSMLEQRNVTGDEEWWREKAWPIFDAVAVMYSELLQVNESTGQWGIRNHTDPDEYANGINNGAFTLASASKMLTLGNYFRQLYGYAENETWNDMALNIGIPYDDSGITIQYLGMNNSVPIKQANVVLNTYPLNYKNNYTEEQSLADLDYYAGKQSPDGPAMTYGILSIIANKVSPSGCSAYTYALNSFEPYSRAPWYQFSEQQIDDFYVNGGTNPAWPFLTGNGGFNQVGPFGWLGVRTDAPDLFIDPALPPQIPHVRIRTFHYGGATVQAYMNYTHTTLTRVETTNEFVRDTFGSNAMPVQVGDPPRERHELMVGETVYVNNRMFASNLTEPDNLLQCLPASSPDSYRQGQYPLAAIDGAISTLWHPDSPERASMIVDMSTVEPQPIVGLKFNWGQAPPITGDVIMSNSSSFEGEAIIIPLGDIEISDAFITDDSDIRPYTGNSTNLAVVSSSGAPIFSGRYLKLQIEGTQGTLSDVGASVAEIALIGEKSRDQVVGWPQVKV